MASVEHFIYEQYAAAADLVRDVVRQQGLEPNEIKDGVILGSGLGDFARDNLAMDPDSSVSIPFNDIFEKIGVPPHHGTVQGHAKSLIVAPLKNDDSRRFVIGQAGREHPYEGISTKRATFWIRVMQLLGVETLIGSNAAGIVTPHTLSVPSLMLVNSHIDLGGDSPLKGLNDDRLGPRFPHMGDHYSAETRAIFHRVAQRLGIPLKEGLYVREPGPNYETPEEIYRLRAMARSMWEEGTGQTGEKRFNNGVTAVVGMSSTYENVVAQHASQSKEHPAFRRGRAWVSALTNYGAGLGPEGFVGNPDQEEVEENAAKVSEMFGQLVHGVLQELRQPVAA